MAQDNHSCTGDDRRKGERRKAQLPFDGPDRRSGGDRRSGKDRRASARVRGDANQE